MFPRNRNLPLDPNSLYDLAVRSLARRAKSSAEIRVLLLRRKAEKADIDAVIQRLRENGYLDDARFARSFVASRIENRLEGRSRVRRDLAARRVRPDISEEAVRSGFEGVDEGTLVREYLRRKLRLTPPLDPATKLGAGKPSAVRSLYARLLRAGFRSDTIVPELKRLMAKVPSQVQGRASSRRDSDDEPVIVDEMLDSLPESTEPEGGPESEPRQ
jgi:regulatory protein